MPRKRATKCRSCPGNSKHIRAHNGQSLTGFDDFSPRQKLSPCAGRKRFTLNSTLKTPELRRHQTVSSIPRRRVSNHCNDASVEIAVLLRQVA